MADRVFGIDLGTTYSCISYVDASGSPVVINNAEGQSTTPSVVYFESANNMVVGETAKETAMVHGDRVVQTVKRAMGDQHYTFEADGRSYRPEEISAFILRKVVKDAEENIGEKITDVVITCPAYFGLNQREATRQAGIIAGLNVKYVIPEPTAAAFAYGMERAENEVTLVYDLGGGTFDVTVIAITPGALDVICTDGDHQLGGKNWDTRIVEFLKDEFSRETGKHTSVFDEDLEAYQELFSKAEKAKIQLTARESVKIAISAAGERATVELSREKFDSLTAPLLDRTIELMKTARGTAADKGYGKIDKILLVGGSSYMPQVRNRIQREFSGEIELRDPNLIVAKGAALFGHKLALEDEVIKLIAGWLNIAPDEVKLDGVDPAMRGKASETAGAKYGLPGGVVEATISKKVSNVSSKSFGLIILDERRTEKVNNLVVVNDRVPATLTREYCTVEDSQSHVRLAVMENLSPVGPDGLIEVADCSEKLGEVNLSFKRPLPIHSPIKVTFELTPDGLLKLFGEDLTTHQDVRVEFQTTAVMSSDDLDRAKQRQMGITVS